jgi:hypothetical protein
MSQDIQPSQDFSFHPGQVIRAPIPIMTIGMVSEGLLEVKHFRGTLLVFELMQVSLYVNFVQFLNSQHFTLTVLVHVIFHTFSLL